MSHRMLTRAYLVTCGLLGLAGMTGATGGLHASGRPTRLRWLGHAAFKIETSAGTVIVTDPYGERTGYTLPSVEADIVTISHNHHDHNAAEAVAGSPRIIDATGKIVTGDTSIEGIPSFHDEVSGEKRGKNIIFKFCVDGLTIVHMGDYGQPITGEQLEALAGTDILLIPVGGTYTIDGAQAAEIVGLLAPKVVIPMHFKTAHATIQVAPVDSFLEKMTDVKRIGHTVEVSKATLPPETETWVMDYIRP